MGLEAQKVSVFRESVWENNNPRQRFAALFQAVMHPGVAYLLTEFPNGQTPIRLRHTWENGVKVVSVIDLATIYNHNVKNKQQQPYVGYVGLPDTTMALSGGHLHHLRKVEAIRQVGDEQYVIENELVREAAWIARRFYTEHRLPRRAFEHMSHYDQNPYDGNFHRAEIIVALGDNASLTLEDLQAHTGMSIEDLKKFLYDLKGKEMVQVTNGRYQLTYDTQNTLYTKLLRPLATLSGIPDPNARAREQKAVKRATLTRRAAVAEEPQEVVTVPQAQVQTPIEASDPPPVTSIQEVREPPQPLPSLPAHTAQQDKPKPEPKPPSYMDIPLPDRDVWNSVEGLTNREWIVLAFCYGELPIREFQVQTGLTNNDIKVILTELVKKLSMPKVEKPKEE